MDEIAACPGLLHRDKFHFSAALMGNRAESASALRVCGVHDSALGKESEADPHNRRAGFNGVPYLRPDCGFVDRRGQ